jgi:hypothetical protein
MARKGALPVKIKQAICADAVAGLRIKEIAQKHGCHRVTVSKVLARFRKEVPDSILADPEMNYRARLKGKSIKALDSALDCDLDAYKRGGIALQVMKGIGEFQGDQPMTGFIIHLEPGSLDWLKPKLVGSSNTKEAEPTIDIGAARLALPEKSQESETK